MKGLIDMFAAYMDYRFPRVSAATSKEERTARLKENTKLLQDVFPEYTGYTLPTRREDCGHGFKPDTPWEYCTKQVIENQEGAHSATTGTDTAVSQAAVYKAELTPVTEDVIGYKVVKAVRRLTHNY